MLDQSPADDPDVIVNTGCVLYKEDKFDEARQKFSEAVTILGYQPDLAYNIALCYYRTKQFGPALKHLAEIIERGVREHPELSVGSHTDGMEVRRFVFPYSECLNAGAAHLFAAYLGRPSPMWRRESLESGRTAQARLMGR